MIPDQLLRDKANVDNLLEYLCYELDRAASDRKDLEADWIRYERLYRARPESPERTFPWKGAANIVLSVVATDVDTTVAGLLGTLRASPNLWSSEALRPDMIDYAARIQEFLEWAQDAELNMESVLADWIPDICKLGTGILKQRYMREQSMMYEWRETAQGTREQMVKRTSTDRPDVRRVALPDFYLPGTAATIEEAPWVGERLQLTWNQLESRVRAGVYSENLLSAVGYHWRQTQARSQYGAYESAMQELDRFVPSFGDRFELFEFWTKYDIARQGEPQSLVCTVHLPTRTYARIDFNPFFAQEKPYSSARFIRQPGRFYGLGLAEILEMTQEEASALRCQRLDNGTVRNTAAFKGRRGSGVKADESIWPGRIILMDNPADDLVPLQMGQSADSTLQEEQFTLEYGQRRSGVSDYQRGGAGTPNISYSTATTTVEMLRQGKLRLDQTMREIQGALSQTGQRVIELYQQFSQGQKPYLVMGQEEGAKVQQVLSFPLDIIRSSVMIRTTATDAHLNKETQIRTNQIISGIVIQFYSQALQAMQIAFNPQLPPPMRLLAFQGIAGALILARRMLDSYGIQDLDRILPDPDQINAFIQQLTVQSQAQPGPGGLGPQPQGPPGLPPGGGGYPGVNGAAPPVNGQQQGSLGPFASAGQL